MSVTGVEGEERDDFSRGESKVMRARSLRLLGSLVQPVRARIALTMVVIIISIALQVAGPALIAIGIDRALPALIDQNDWMPSHWSSAPTCSAASWGRR